MFPSSSFLDYFDNSLEASVTFEHSPSVYPILVRSLGPVPEMGTSRLPTEIPSCENETEERSTFFASAVVFEAGDDSFAKPLLRSTFPRPLLWLVTEVAISASPLFLLVEVSSIQHYLLEITD